jgi:hypothetical protein
MDKNSRQGMRRGKSQAQAARQRMYAHMVILLLTFTFIIAGAFWLFHGEKIGAHTTSSPTPPESVAAPEAKAELDRLQGRWLRPDGGYVMEIRGIDARGKMATAYFNPRPIKVSRATAAQDGTTTKVFIELRDTNYPGSTYTLTYDPQSDQLKGVYFQAALHQSSDVVFVRME